MTCYEVPLFSKSTIFEQYNKGSGKGLFQVKRKLLKYSICFFYERNFKIKRTDAINSRLLKIGNFDENSQLWHRKYTSLNYSRTA